MAGTVSNTAGPAQRPNAKQRNLFLTFEGVGSKQRASFDVMVGDNPPTITDGYAMWTTVSRWLQRGLTIFQGYNPLQLTVEVRFGIFVGNEWADDDATGRRNETDIGRLQWMAGAHFGAGPSPIVYMWAHGTQGHDTTLIPAPAGNGRPWIVTGLTWGQAWRNANGYRVQQDATVVLTSYLNLDNPPNPVPVNGTGHFIRTAAGRDTALKVANSPLVASPLKSNQRLARQLLEDAKNNPVKGTTINLSRKSVSWRIPHGLDVWVSTSQGP